jgi:hypothetical protein
MPRRVRGPRALLTAATYSTTVRALQRIYETPHDLKDTLLLLKPQCKSFSTILHQPSQVIRDSLGEIGDKYALESLWKRQILDGPSLMLELNRRQRQEFY